MCVRLPPHSFDELRMHVMRLREENVQLKQQVKDGGKKKAVKAVSFA